MNTCTRAVMFSQFTQKFTVHIAERAVKFMPNNNPQSVEHSLLGKDYKHMDKVDITVVNNAVLCKCGTLTLQMQR